jgi:cAMP-dependent protein kinase regulator
MGCGGSAPAPEEQPKPSTDKGTGDKATTPAPAEDDEEARERAKMAKMGNKKRNSISGGGASEDEIRNYKPPSYEKANASKEVISKTMKGNDKMKVLGIDKLSGEQLNEMIMAFQEKRVKQNEDVIRQGENGEALFVIESGTYDIFVARPDNDGRLGVPMKVATFGPGSLFGELAILYNSPRAATVRCVSAEGGLLWSLAQTPFQMLTKKCGMERVEQYSGWLKDVPLLKVLNLLEISRVAEACEDVLFEKDQEIVKQGEAGDAFYILEEGECAAFITQDGKEKQVKKYSSQGEYFGEIALITDAPRKATVKGITDGSVVRIEKESFINLLGPILDRLKEQAASYPQYADVINTS